MASIITIPPLVVAVNQDIRQVRSDLSYGGNSDGDTETIVYSPPRWGCSMRSDDEMDPRKMAHWVKMYLQMQGRINRLAIFDFLRTTPLGTMRGNVTTVTAALAGDKSVTITGGATQAAKTLFMGDWLGFNQTGINRQVVSITDDVTTNAQGQVTVNFEPYLRYDIPAGASVILDKPTWLGQMTTTDAGWSNKGSNQGAMSLEFIESWLA